MPKRPSAHTQLQVFACSTYSWFHSLRCASVETQFLSHHTEGQMTGLGGVGSLVKLVCNKRYSLKTSTFFTSSKMNMKQLLWALWSFANELPNSFLVDNLGLSRTTTVDWYNFCREVCMVWVEDHSQKIGGPGLTVEIDESMFTKRKYHKEQRRAGTWVFGGVCRQTGECFVSNCPKSW